MKKIALYTLLFLLGNIATLYLISFLADKIDNQNIGDSIGVVIALMLILAIAQIIVGLFLIGSEKRAEIGKAMSLAVGIIFLVGLSLCSGIFH